MHATQPFTILLRQLSRAMFADRALGDEWARLSEVSLGSTMSSSFLESWLPAALSSPPVLATKPPLFSDASLRQAMDVPSNKARLALILTDIVGFGSEIVSERLGVNREAIDREREDLSVPSGTVALVIEDEPLIAADLAGMLRALGIASVFTAGSAADALAFAEADPPDIILADMQLQDNAPTGMSAADFIRQATGCAVIAVTGHPERVLQGYDHEPDFVIAKPYRPEAIRAAAVHALDAGPLRANIVSI